MYARNISKLLDANEVYNFLGTAVSSSFDTPGHLPGHMGGVAFTGVDEWVVMGGDCCHHLSLLMHQAAKRDGRSGRSTGVPSRSRLGQENFLREH